MRFLDTYEQFASASYNLSLFSLCLLSLVFFLSFGTVSLEETQHQSLPNWSSCYAGLLSSSDTALLIIVKSQKSLKGTHFTAIITAMQLYSLYCRQELAAAALRQSLMGAAALKAPMVSRKFICTCSKAGTNRERIVTSWSWVIAWKTGWACSYNSEKEMYSQIQLTRRASRSQCKEPR